MKKLYYTEPTVEILRLAPQDILTTSDGSTTDPNNPVGPGGIGTGGDNTVGF